MKEFVSQARWERKHPAENVNNFRGWGDPRAVRRYFRRYARSSHLDVETRRFLLKDARAG